MKVNDRIIYAPEKGEIHAEIFNQAIQEVLDGSCKVKKGSFLQLKLTTGQELLAHCTIRYYLDKQTKEETFSYDSAVEFVEKMKTIMGFDEIDYPLSKWFEDYIQKCFFHKREVGASWDVRFDLRDDVSFTHPNREDILNFICYVAILNIKFGPSYASVTADSMFDAVTALGSNRVAVLKKEGSGNLPKSRTDIKSELFSLKANDAFATIRIVLKEESEEAYTHLFDALNGLLSLGEFPKSYAIEFRSPNKNYLPIKGLPKKGVNQLFANAVQYPSLYPKIAEYARLAMHQYEWYTNLEGEQCCMPSTFAVMALGLADEAYFDLVEQYMQTTDDEHSELQLKFIPALVDRFGISASILPVLAACFGSFQSLPTKPISKEVLNQESVQQLLLDFKENPQNYLKPIYQHTIKMGERSYQPTVKQVVLGLYGGENVKNQAKIPENLK